MTYPKVCLNCNTPFEAKRDAARYCSERCKNDWHTENRAAMSQLDPQRVEGHALDEVRGLLEEEKPEWAVIVREHARRTLLATGYLSAADFIALGVPDEHCNLPGAQLGAFVNAGYMEAISFKRWSAEAKASRKSGKYWVYRITLKGKEQLGPLAGLDAPDPEGNAAGEVEQSLSEAAPSTGRGSCHRAVPHGAGSAWSIESGEVPVGAGSPAVKSDAAPPPTVATRTASLASGSVEGTDKRASGVTDPPSATGPDAQLLQLEGEKPKPRNAIFDDDWETAA